MIESELVRVDRNIINHRIFLAYGQDEAMVKNVLYYLCYNYQADLWGYRVIDPYEFAKSMGLDIKYLRRKHHSPYQMQKLGEQQFKEDKDSGKKMYDTIFENVLYQLAFNSAEISYTYKNEHGGLTQVNAPFSFLTELKIEKLKTRGRDKYVYRVKYNEKLRENLAGYFLFTNKDEWSLLSGSPAQQNLYALLTSLKSILRNVPEDKRTASPQFDELVRCNRISQSTEPKTAKMLVNRNFKAVAKKCPSLGAKLEWAGKNRWKYTPKITFDYSNNISESTKAKQERFWDLFREYLQELHEKLGIKSTSLHEWAKDSRLHHDEKRLAFMKAYNISFGEKHAINKWDERIKKWLNDPTF